MSRFVAVAAAIALVVAGVVIGALGTFLALERAPSHDRWRHSPGPPPPPGPPRPPGPFTRQMELRLELSEEQERQIHSILRTSREESEAIRRELRPRLESQLQATRDRIASVLTPEQRVKFEALVREDRHRAERFFLDGPPGPPGPPPDGGPPP